MTNTQSPIAPPAPTSPPAEPEKPWFSEMVAEIVEPLHRELGLALYLLLLLLISLALALRRYFTRERRRIRPGRFE